MMRKVSRYESVIPLFLHNFSLEINLEIWPPFCDHHYSMYFFFKINLSEFCLYTLQKLVNETFQKLWFTPTPAHDKETMTRKILNITDVVIWRTFVCFCDVSQELQLKSPSSKTWSVINPLHILCFFKCWILVVAFLILSPISS